MSSLMDPRSGTPANTALPPSAQARRQSCGHWTMVPATLFPAHAQRWDALNDSSARSPFLVSTFIQTLLAHFGQPDVRLALCQRHGRVVAMALLRPGGRYAWTCFQPSQLIVAPLVHEQGLPVAALALDLLAALPPTALSLAFTQLDPDISPRPTEQARIGTLDYIETCVIDLPPGDFASFEARLSKNTLANLRKRAAKASRECGEVALDVFSTVAEVEPFLRDYARIESAGWKAAAGTAIREGDPQYAFYRDVLVHSAAAQRARMFRLRFGDQVAALEAVLITHETALLLKTTHDETLRQYGPGQRLFYEILRWLSAHLPSVQRVETYGPINEKQRTFATAIKRMYHLNAYRYRIVATAHRMRIGAHRRRAAVSAPPATAIEPHTGAAAFFGSQEWFDLLRTTVSLPGRYLEARTPACAAGGQANFTLPLQYVRSPTGRRDLVACANFYSGLYAPIVTAHTPAQQAADALLTLLQGVGWDTLRLAPLDRESPLFGVLIDALSRAGIVHDTYFCFGNWHLPLPARDFADYLRTRPSRLQNTLKRAGRRFERIPGARYLLVRQPGAALEAAIGHFQMLYCKRGRAPEPHPEFIPELCRRTAEKGQLRLGLLMLGDRPVAAQIWIVCAGSALIFKLAFDPELRSLSVGTLLTARMLQSALEEDRVREIDYLTGDDPYKKDWMTHRRERYGIIAFNPRTVFGLAAATRHFAGRQLRRWQAHWAGASTPGDTAPAEPSR